MLGEINNFDWRECSPMRYWSFSKTYSGDKNVETKELIFSGDYIGAQKRDGYYQRIIKDDEGNVMMISRNRNVKKEVVDKIDWVPHIKEWVEKLPNGTCLLCEIYLPNNEGSKNVTTLLGCTKERSIARQRDKKLHLYVFDVMAYDGTNFITDGIGDRIKYLDTLKNTESLKSEYVDYATYKRGKELWEMLGEILEAGDEGIVISREDCPVYFKRTPARMTLKIKKEISQTINCVFTGKGTPPTKEYKGKEMREWEYWINERTDERLKGKHFDEYMSGEPLLPVTKTYFNEWVGSMEIGVVKGNKVVPIGYLSGLADEIKANPAKYKLQPIEVTAMEIDYDAHTLRHARLVKLRDDLTLNDCTWERCFNSEEEENCI